LEINDKENEMYLRKVTYQLGLRVKSLVPRFHKSHLENLALLVIGIAYSWSVSLPKAAGAVPYKRTQVESRVERFERLLQCEKPTWKANAKVPYQSVGRNDRFLPFFTFLPSPRAFFLKPSEIV
jgi:hypothetical protein